MNRSLAALGLATVLVVSASCSDDSAPEGAPIRTEPSTTAPTTPAESVPAADPVDGRWFVGDPSSVTGRTLVEGTQLSMRFEAGQMSAGAGCNTLQAAYEIDTAGSLVVDQMSSTAMGCDAARHDQDDWLTTFLQSGPVIGLDGPTLTISHDAVIITLTDREVADPDRPLEGVTWTLDGQISGQTASHSVVAKPATLTFSGGVLSVDTGCNTGSTSYRLGDGSVTVQPIALTRMACDDSTMQQEAAIVTVLDGTLTYAIDARRLTLMSGPDGLTLTAG